MLPEARLLDKALRDDVRLLGEILGRVIAADRGPAFVDRIEQIRALAKAARVRRRRRMGRAQRTARVDSGGCDLRCCARIQSVPESGEHRRTAPCGRGSGRCCSVELPQAEGLDAAIDALQIELVLTAHPTEVLRRTLVMKYDAIGRALAQQPHDVVVLERLIAEAWHSDEVRQRTADAAGRSEMGLCGNRTIVVGCTAAIPAAVRREPCEMPDRRR